MPPPPMPSPDVAQYASSSAFSSMWGMFSSSSVCAVCFRFPYLSCSQILLSAGEVTNTFVSRRGRENENKNTYLFM